MDPMLLSLAGFAFATSITPGPNNVMVAAAAANHGVRAALPLVAGIVVGFVLMLAIVGLGLAGVVLAYPPLHAALRWAMAGWLLLLAWRVAGAGAPGHDGPRRPPIGIVGAMLFQWVNPKAWLLALSAAAEFVLPDRPPGPQVAAVCAAFLVLGTPSMLAWALLGSGAGRLLQAPARLRAFNVGMAVLLVASVAPLLWAF